MVLVFSDLKSHQFYKVKICNVTVDTPGCIHTVPLDRYDITSANLYGSSIPVRLVHTLLPSDIKRPLTMYVSFSAKVMLVYSDRHADDI